MDVVAKIVSCNFGHSENKAMFYSGGLDSLNTLINHWDEKPDEEGWKKTHKVVKNVSEQFSLKDIVIRSNFRVFDRETELDNDFKKQLQDSWWHGVKHGIGLLGHIAPYVYIHKIDTVYIASSNSVSDGAVRCASDPQIDNYVSFSSGSICLIMILYWISYMVIRKKY